MSRHDLAERVRAGDPVQGLIVKMPAHAVVEMAAYAGFDFVVVDTEHGADDAGELEHHLRAADAAGIPAIVRVAALGGAEILRALDAGATGIVVPHVGSAAAAAEAVRHAHYPPVGSRGLAVSTRAGAQGSAGLREHLARAERTTLVLVQVEDAQAVTQIEAIADVPRVDAVFLGPTDLSLSLGHPGELEHPAVAAAIDRVADTLLARDAPRLCVLAQDEAERDAWLARGARVILFTAHSLFTERLREVARAPAPAGTGDGVVAGGAALDSIHPRR